MARLSSKSDDSEDSDYDPSKKRMTIAHKKDKGAAASTKKEGTGIDTRNPYPTPTSATFGGKFPHFPLLSYSSLEKPAIPAADSDSPIYLKYPTADQHHRYSLAGMLQHDDEVLKGQLNYSRRGWKGHCSRDTADLWVYILQLFFKPEAGYVIEVQGYHQDPEHVGSGKSTGTNAEDSDTDIEGDNIPAGLPVWIQVWKQEGQFNPYYRQFVLTATIPTLTIVCSSEEARFTEYPAIRHKAASAKMLYAPAGTPMQREIYTRMATLLQAHNTSAKEKHQSAAPVKYVIGAVACGTTVRFYKCKADEAKHGFVRPLSAQGLDMVNGDPSLAMSSVERTLERVVNPNKKSKLSA